MKQKYYILIGILFIIILIAVLIKQTTKEEIQIEDYPTIEFSDLMKNPNIYHNKKICIIATFTSGREEESLEHIIWIKHYDQDFINGNKVLACGIFKTRPGPMMGGFGHLGQYKYQIEVNRTLSKLLE